MSRFLLTTAMGLSVLVAGGEKQQPSKVTAGDVGRKVAEAAGAAAGYATQEKDEYVARAQKAIDGGRAEIGELEAQAEKARAGAKRGLQRRIEDLEARWQVAQRKLGELKSASGEAWKDLRSRVDRAVEDLRRPGASRRSGEAEPGCTTTSRAPSESV